MVKVPEQKKISFLGPFPGGRPLIPSEMRRRDLRYLTLSKIEGRAAV